MIKRFQAKVPAIDPETPLVDDLFPEIQSIQTLPNVWSNIHDARFFAGRVREEDYSQIYAITEAEQRRINIRAAIVSITASLAVLGAAYGLSNLDKEQRKTDNEIEACVGNMVGHTVDFARNPEDGNLMIPREFLKEANSCEH